MSKIKFQNFKFDSKIISELTKIGNKKALERFLELYYSDEEWIKNEYGYIINLDGDSLTRQIVRFGNTYYIFPLD